MKKPTVKFTATALSNVGLPAGKSTLRISDPTTPGLFCKIGRQKRCFYLQKRIRDGSSTPKTFFIGNLAFMNVEEARRAARQLAASCDKGINPADAKANKSWTLDTAWKAYIEARRGSLRPSTVKINMSRYRNYLAHWGKRALSTITPQMLAALFVESPYSSSCQSALILFKSIWEYARLKTAISGKPTLGDNPYTTMRKLVGDAWHLEPKREAAIVKLADIGKYVAWLEFLADHTAHIRQSRQFRAYLLCLFTGLRYHEVSTLQWDAVDFDAGIIHIMREFSKKKRPHIVTMSSYVRGLLQGIKSARCSVSPYVFPNVNGSGHIMKDSAMFRQVERILGYSYGSHANRRTFMCFAMMECQIPFPVVQKMLNHKGKGNSVTEKHYFLLEQFDPGGLRKEFQRVSDGMVRLRDAWLAQHRNTLELPGSGDVVAIGRQSRTKKAGVA